LGKYKEAFETAGAEIIAVFREEKEGEKGLAKIKRKSSTTFTLALDSDKEKTPRYSTGRREFTGYVINPQGVITEVFEGNVRNRAKAAQLIKALKAAGKPAEGSDSKEAAQTEGSASKSEAKGSDSKASEATGSDSKATTQGSAKKATGSDSK